MLILQKLMIFRLKLYEPRAAHEYLLPELQTSLMVLKQGRTVIHHFAHKPPSFPVSGGSGEIYAHLASKTRFFVMRYAQ